MNNEDKKFEYLYFARSFLTLAYYGSDKVKRKIKTGKYKNPLEELIPDPVFASNYLLVPIFYNLKHAMEIFLKSTLKFLGQDHIKKSHDLKECLDMMKLKLNQKQNKKLKKEINALEKIITKYYQCSFLKNKIGKNYVIVDKKNTLFKYADADFDDLKISLNYCKILPKFTESDIQEIQKDIKQIWELFFQIGQKILDVKPKIGPSILKIN